MYSDTNTTFNLLINDVVVHLTEVMSWNFSVFENLTKFLDKTGQLKAVLHDHNTNKINQLKPCVTNHLAQVSACVAFIVTFHVIGLMMVSRMCVLL